jgi:hypothetical protein
VCCISPIESCCLGHTCWSNSCTRMQLANLQLISVSFEWVLVSMVKKLSCLCSTSLWRFLVWHLHTFKNSQAQAYVHILMLRNYIYTCVCVYMNTCMYTYIHTYIHTYVYTHTHIHTHTYKLRSLIDWYLHCRSQRDALGLQNALLLIREERLSTVGQT